MINPAAVTLLVGIFTLLFLGLCHGTDSILYGCGHKGIWQILIFKKYHQTDIYITLAELYFGVKRFIYAFCITVM
jgi:hypothetical protein